MMMFYLTRAAAFTFSLGKGSRVKHCPTPPPVQLVLIPERGAGGNVILVEDGAGV